MLSDEPDVAPDPEAADAVLVRQALAGDEDALERLLVLHESRVLRLLRLLGVRHEDREDVAQEVFLRVFRHLGGFRPGRSFRGWLYRITVNAAHDHRNTLQRRAGREELGWEGSADHRPDVAPGPEETAATRDRVKRLEAALGDLSERERAAFVLCDMERLGSRQAAKALGITAITVRRHLGRARARLREILLQGEKIDPSG